MDIFDDGPGDGDAIVGAGAASQFIKEDEASLGEVVEDAGRLVHLHHEGGLAQSDVIGGTHAGEDLVYQPDGSRFGGHEGADLCHQCDQGRLT